MPNIDNTITKAIIRKLKATGKSKYTVAKDAGIPYTTFTRKLDKGSFTAVEIASIADALDSDFKELVGVAA